MPSKPKYPRTVGSLLSSNPLLKSLSAESQRLNELLEIVRSHLPEPLANHCHSVSSGKNSLILYTESSAWASRLRFISRQLQKKLQDSGFGVDKITIRVSINRTRKTPNRERIRQLTPENAKLLQQIAENIPDEALKASLQRLSRHVRKN